jgi:hypothetical protein
MVQRDVSNLSGSIDDIVCGSEDFGIDFEGRSRGHDRRHRAWIVFDAPARSVHLVMLANAVSLRNVADGSPMASAHRGKPRPPSVRSRRRRQARRRVADGRLRPTSGVWNGQRVGLCNAGWNDLPLSAS